MKRIFARAVEQTVILVTMSSLALLVQQVLCGKKDNAYLDVQMATMMTQETVKSVLPNAPYVLLR